MSYRLQLIASKWFLPSSLSNLINNLVINSNDNLIECKCLCCNKNYQKFDENLKKQFFNAYRFSSHGIIKFILLLRKGVYRYKYMNYWEKFNETSLLKKEDIF